MAESLYLKFDLIPYSSLLSQKFSIIQIRIYVLILVSFLSDLYVQKYIYNRLEHVRQIRISQRVNIAFYLSELAEEGGSKV